MQAHRLYCMHCNRKYTPEPKEQVYPKSMRQRAAKMYIDGDNIRRIALHLKVVPRTVAFRSTDLAEALPNVPKPREVQEEENETLHNLSFDRSIGIAGLSIRVPICKVA